MAIWALGEIGGEAVKTVLNNLAALADETGDDLLGDVVAEAQGSASLVGDDMLPLFDFSDYDGDLDDDRMNVLSLDELDDEDEDDDYDYDYDDEVDEDEDDEDDDFGMDDDDLYM